MTPSTPFTPMMPFAPYAIPALPSAHPVRPALAADETSRLVTELAPRVLAVTRAVLGRGHSDVDDAYQQGILELIRALPSFRGDCAPIHFRCPRSRLRPASR
jgi:hypothetical protein